MWAAAAELLCCPECRAPLQHKHHEDGAVRCPACAHPLALDGPVFRLLPRGDGVPSERRTLAAFERQWRSYGRLRRLFGKDSAAMARNLVGARMGTRIDAAWYRGKRVLDAGCGHGRYLTAFADLGADVVGLDAGRGPELAGVALDDRRITLVQGSVLRLPFRDASFDLVFSDGVVHHTPDPRAAFLELARVVKPGGALYVWVYPREGALRETVSGTVRTLTTRLPGPAVRALCFALAPLTLAVRSYSKTQFGRATWAECAQVVHDWLAPPLQSHHEWDEVAGWARAAGLADLERLPIPVGITAWRPVREGGRRDALSAAHATERGERVVPAQAR
jgi:SAM-dependent methyltransferase